jgi:ankyrin repeat protein
MSNYELRKFTHAYFCVQEAPDTVKKHLQQAQTTLLHLASKGGYVDLVLHLLSCDSSMLPQQLGAKEPVKNRTALHLASSGGHAEVVRQLLDSQHLTGE